MRALAFLFFAAWSGLVAMAQQASAVDAPSDAARAITAWVEAYDRGQLGPKGRLRSGERFQPAYVAFARSAGAITEADEERISHLDALNKLLWYATKRATAADTEALLALAAAGLESSFLDPMSLELRELGHTTLLGIEDQRVWFHLLRAAAGDRLPIFGEVVGVDRGESPLLVGSARRVAALRLLGAKDLAVFRVTLEAALSDQDPRVRLAAAEAFTMRPRADLLPRVQAAIATERHAVVAQSLVHLLGVLLRDEALDAPTRADAVAAALQRFGRTGWRTDMELLDLVENWPHRDAVPVLISALDLVVRAPDALTAAINKRASPILRDRAAALLRAMTGAIFPADDVKAWQEFWSREGERVVVPRSLRREQEGTTRATFFGVPVTGSSVAFVIDTSGSMDERPAGAVPSADRRSRADTRLRAAKEQLVAAVQAMPAESQFVVVTFADRAHVWTDTPVHPGPAAMRSLTELTSKLKAFGGTNLFDGLSTGLFLRDQRYGDVQTQRLDEVFVLSDGEPTTGEVRDPEELLRIVRETNKYARVRINTVYTGVGEGPELLRRLAEESGGVFVQR
ncbi:MAG: VWA domain-containing protein [Planctomycetes bacterium]|nr:VWA domain-containing protein [Planctomycetota bacterium]